MTKKPHDPKALEDVIDKTHVAGALIAVSPAAVLSGGPESVPAIEAHTAEVAAEEAAATPARTPRKR